MDRSSSSHNAADLHSPSRQINEEQNEVPLQTFSGPHLNSEEVSSHDQLPVPAREFLPCGFATSFGRWLDAVPLQDLGNSASSNVVPQIKQSALNPAVAPIAVLFSHPNHQSFDLSNDPRSARVPDAKFRNEALEVVVPGLKHSGATALVLGSCSMIFPTATCRWKTKLGSSSAILFATRGFRRRRLGGLKPDRPRYTTAACFSLATNLANRS